MIKYRVFISVPFYPDSGIRAKFLGSQYPAERYEILNGTREGESTWHDHQLPGLLKWLVSEGLSGCIVIDREYV